MSFGEPRRRPCWVALTTGQPVRPPGPSRSGSAASRRAPDRPPTRVRPHEPAPKRHSTGRLLGRRSCTTRGKRRRGTGGSARSTRARRSAATPAFKLSLQCRGGCTEFSLARQIRQPAEFPTLGLGERRGIHGMEPPGLSLTTGHRPLLAALTPSPSPKLAGEGSLGPKLCHNRTQLTTFRSGRPKSARRQAWEALVRMSIAPSSQ